MSAVRIGGILTDIEGTTTDIGFVHQVLFPYAARHLPDYLTQHAQTPWVRECLASVCQTVFAETGQPPETVDPVAVLLDWIRADRKHTALKALQGAIWENGYRQGDFQGHVYPDVPPALADWSARQIRLAVFSSGSVQAQQLLFGHSTHGDLTPCFSQYFDTTTGPKQQAESYRRIAQQMAILPGELLFLSDVGSELIAAREAGYRVIQLCRPTLAPSQRKADIPGAPDFDAVTQLLATQP